MNFLRIRGREPLHSASRFLGLTIYPFSGIRAAAGPSSASGAPSLWDSRWRLRNAMAGTACAPRGLHVTVPSTRQRASAYISLR